MKKRSTATTPAITAETARPETASRPANNHKTYQFTRFQYHPHGRQFKSPIGINHKPGVY